MLKLLLMKKFLQIKGEPQNMDSRQSPTYMKKNTQLIHPTRLAGIDCTQWFKQGLTEEFIGLEEKIDKFSEKNKISCICGYDINKIPDKKTLKKVVKSHGYVMLDNPHMLFKSGI